MLQDFNASSLYWVDKTLSELRAQKLEACEQRLLSSPERGLFEVPATGDVHNLWRFSHDGQDLPDPPVLLTARDLRMQVTFHLELEAALLSMQEYLLVERLVTQNGIMELSEWEEYEAAESLVQRLWCTVALEEDQLLLKLQPPLLPKLQGILALSSHHKARETCYKVETFTRALLYIFGYLHSFHPMDILYHELSQEFFTPIRMHTLFQRLLRTSFSHTFTAKGDLMLIHPGFVHPIFRQSTRPKRLRFPPYTEKEDLGFALEGILPEEVNLHIYMIQLFRGYTRPGVTPKEASEDLRILAKQGVNLPELREVLSSMISVAPTPAMEDALYTLVNTTPRWQGVAATQVH